MRGDPNEPPCGWNMPPGTYDSDIPQPEEGPRVCGWCASYVPCGDLGCGLCGRMAEGADGLEAIAACAVPECTEACDGYEEER